VGNFKEKFAMDVHSATNIIDRALGEIRSQKATKRRGASRQPATTGLADWIEANVHLPQGLSAEPGPVKLWPWQVEIANAITDPRYERVSLIKPTRVGFSALLTAAIAYHVVHDPCPILCLLPTESDCRDFLVSDIEPLFDASPALQGRLPTPTTAGRSSRNTLLHRIFPAGNLKVVAGKAPRNLRRHTCRLLMIDEADAIAVSAEGDPIMLAERRTLSFPDRKIIVGSTPLDESMSHVSHCYEQSDQRIFECPCPACGVYNEILWRHIEWPEGKPEQAAYRCPHCQESIDESHKPEMVKHALWRATHPEVKGHAGFRLNALVSLLANASWSKLAQEFLVAKNDTSRLRVFTNTVLGEVWRDQATEVSEAELMDRVEGFDLDHIPAEVLFITAGVDLSQDNVQTSILGHARDGTVFVLGHITTWGSPLDNDTLADLDNLLRQRWRHPSGSVIGVDCAVIDAGSGEHFDTVMSFCKARHARRILAGKGAAGWGRPAIMMSKTRKGRLFIIGVDGLKSQILSRLTKGREIRFSHTLDLNYFEQLTSESRVTRMARGRPVIRFERKAGTRSESIDCFAYALSAKAALKLNDAAFMQREEALRSPRSSAKPAKEAPEMVEDTTPPGSENSFLAATHSKWKPPGQTGSPWSGGKSWWDRNQD
jgi:phage terminase large subunit GpA-like protein